MTGWSRSRRPPPSSSHRGQSISWGLLDALGDLVGLAIAATQRSGLTYRAVEVLHGLRGDFLAQVAQHQRLLLGLRRVHRLHFRRPDRLPPHQLVLPPLDVDDHFEQSPGHPGVVLDGGVQGIGGVRLDRAAGGAFPGEDSCPSLSGPFQMPQPLPNLAGVAPIFSLRGALLVLLFQEVFILHVYLLLGAHVGLFERPRRWLLGWVGWVLRWLRGVAILRRRDRVRGLMFRCRRRRLRRSRVVRRGGAEVDVGGGRGLVARSG